MTELAPDRRLVSVIVALLALLATLVPLGIWWLASQSSASFADAEVLEANHLGAGTLDIEVGTTDTVLEAANMAPGDTISAQLEVANVGDLPLRYGVRARTGGGILTDWLSFRLWQSVEICSPDGLGEDLATDMFLSSADTTLVALDDGALPLEPGAGAMLCLSASLPLEAPNEVQGQRLVIDLVVDAEHDISAEGGDQ
jgi:hypothetical protein